MYQHLAPLRRSRKLRTPVKMVATLGASEAYVRIKLVNMPFSALYAPSLGLTQLKAVLDETFGSAVVTTIHYLNHDFGDFIGAPLYQAIAAGGEHLYSGLGDWFFRSVAYPEATDNSDAYFRRFYRQQSAGNAALKRDILHKRADANRFLDDLIEQHRLADADIVGFTSMFAQSVASFALARKLKALSPGLTIVMGGANCEAPMGRSIVEHVPWLDFVFGGPALKSFPEFVRRRLNHDVTSGPLNGVFHRSHAPDDSSIDREGTTPLASRGDELDINELILLNYDDFLDQVERRWPDRAVKPKLFFETSRGCWWGQKAHCTFCGLNGATMNYRAMAPDQALAQFNHLFSYAGRSNGLECVDNILPKEYLRQVFPRLNTPPGMALFYEVKADLSEEDVAVLARARVLAIQPGIESLATSTLHLMRKGTSAFTNLRLLSYCALYGIAPAWNLLVGFPNEVASVFDKYCADIPKITHLSPPSGVFPVRFDRFSPYFDQANTYGLDLRPLDMYAFAYPLSTEAIAGMAYYFADHNFGARYQQDMTARIGDVRAAVAAWKMRYSGRDGGVPAELFVTDHGDSTIVHDSRSGQMREVALSSDASEVLRLLRAPTRVGEIETALPHLGGPRLSAALDSLRELQFLFEEGDRLVSIVLPRPSDRLAKATSDKGRQTNSAHVMVAG